MDKWLEALKKVHDTPSRSEPPAASAADSFLSVVFDTGAIEQETVVADPVGQAIEKAQFQSLAKASVGDCAWDAPLDKFAPAAGDPTGFKTRSAARFEKTVTVIRKVFVGHPEEAERAIEIAQEMLDAARAEVIATSSIIL